MNINRDLKDIAYFLLGHSMVKNMDWIYITAPAPPSLGHSKLLNHLNLQFSCL